MVSHKHKIRQPTHTYIVEKHALTGERGFGDAGRRAWGEIGCSAAGIKEDAGLCAE